MVQSLKSCHSRKEPNFNTEVGDTIRSITFAAHFDQSRILIGSGQAVVGKIALPSSAIFLKILHIRCRDCFSNHLQAP
jgi:hypothetical protein